MSLRNRGASSALLAFLIAACATAPPPSLPAVASVAPADLPGPQSSIDNATTGPLPDPVSPSPGASAPASEAPFATPHANTGLEQILATAIGDASFQTWSLAGEAAVDGATYLPLLVKGLGKGAADLSTAVGGDPSGSVDTLVFAVRVNAVSSGDLLTVFLVVTSLSDTTEETIAGKAVRAIDAEGVRSWIYVAADTLYLIQSSDAAVAEAIIGRLP